MCPVDAARLLQDLEPTLEQIEQNLDRHLAVATEWMAHRTIVQAALQIAPSVTLRAITGEIVTFQMPGSIVPGFNRKAAQLAQAGIYDLRIHHDDFVVPLVRQWGVFEVEGLDPDGERAREQRADALAALDTQVSGFEAQRAAAEAERAARQPSAT